MYARYQVESAEAFILGTEAWAVAQDPGRTVVAGGTSETSVDDLSLETQNLAGRVNRFDIFLDELHHLLSGLFVPVQPEAPPTP